MNEPTMLYRCPGPHSLHGGMYDYTIADSADIEKALAEGWFLSTPEALAAHQASISRATSPVAEVPADDAPPTRAELEAKASELKLKFDGRTSDKKLGELIAAKLKA